MFDFAEISCRDAEFFEWTRREVLRFRQSFELVYSSIKALDSIPFHVNRTQRNSLLASNSIVCEIDAFILF